MEPKDREGRRSQWGVEMRGHELVRGGGCREQLVV